MQTAKKVFGQLINFQGFLQDLRSFVELSGETQQKLYDVYITSPYRNYFCRHSEKLATILNLEESIAHDIFHVFDFFAFDILHENDSEEIIKALKSLKFNDKHISNTENILTQLETPDTQHRLKILDLIDDEIGIINPHLPQINYHIDQRLVVDKDKVITKLPITILQLRTKHRSDNRIVFELTEEDIEYFASKFAAIKKQLIDLKNTNK